jgi:hypothetical protein
MILCGHGRCLQSSGEPLCWMKIGPPWCEAGQRAPVPFMIRIDVTSNVTRGRPGRWVTLTRMSPRCRERHLQVRSIEVIVGNAETRTGARCQGDVRGDATVMVGPAGVSASSTSSPVCAPRSAQVQPLNTSGRPGVLPLREYGRAVLPHRGVTGRFLL